MYSEQFATDIIILYCVYCMCSVPVVCSLYSEMSLHGFDKLREPVTTSSTNQATEARVVNQPDVSVLIPNFKQTNQVAEFVLN